MDVLSEDEDNGRLEELLQQAEGGTRARKGESKRAGKRAQGGKRQKKFTPPLPLDFQKSGTGYQQYKLPNERRIYERRSYDYTDEHKLGQEVQARPVPPTLFADTYLFQKAKRLVLDAESDAFEQTPHEKLQHRISARIVRLSCNYFIRVSLAEYVPKSQPPSVRMHLHARPVL